jgi:hypothetical protein
MARDVGRSFDCQDAVCWYSRPLRNGLGADAPELLSKANIAAYGRFSAIKCCFHAALKAYLSIKRKIFFHGLKAHKKASFRNGKHWQAYSGS